MWKSACPPMMQATKPPRGCRRRSAPKFVSSASIPRIDVCAIRSTPATRVRTRRSPTAIRCSSSRIFARRPQRAPRSQRAPGTADEPIPSEHRARGVGPVRRGSHRHAHHGRHLDEARQAMRTMPDHDHRPAILRVGAEPLETLGSYRMDERVGGVTFGMNAIVVLAKAAPCPWGWTSKFVRVLMRSAPRMTGLHCGTPATRHAIRQRFTPVRQRKAEGRLEAGRRKDAIGRPTRGRRISAVAIGTSRGSDASPRIARAKSYQLACPERKGGTARIARPARASRRRRCAPSPRERAAPVGTPIWSATMVSSSFPPRACGSSAGSSCRASRTPSSCAARSRAHRPLRPHARLRAWSIRRR